MNLAEFSLSDSDEIENLFTKVFSASEGRSEGLQIGKLAHDLMNITDPGDLYGFVAMEDGQIIGSIFFSRLRFDSEINAFILAPVAIRTDCQGQGIGQKLINFGINRLKENGVGWVFTYGDPDFYKRVGFGPISEKVAKAPLKLTYPFGWLCQSLDGGEIESISGNSYCVAALNHPEYW